MQAEYWLGVYDEPLICGSYRWSWSNEYFKGETTPNGDNQIEVGSVKVEEEMQGFNRNGCTKQSS